MKRSSVFLGLCVLVLGSYVLASPPSGYHLLKKIPFGAAPGSIEYFDYIRSMPRHVVSISRMVPRSKWSTLTARL